MEKQIEAVKLFHETFQIENGTTPRLLDKTDFLLRFRLMEEEASEYLDACSSQNLVGVADALGDQLYILLGTILRHGMQDKIVEVFNEIQRSNMSKLDENGQPIFREDRKIMKGPNYTPPDLKSILDK